MIFRHQNLEKILEWNENIHMCELVIECPSLLRSILTNLNSGESESKLNFSDHGKVVSLDKEIDVIFNPLKLDFNNRRAMTTLLKVLVKSSLSETFYLDTGKLKTRIIEYLDDLIDNENFSFEVAADEFSIDDLAKATGLHIVGDEDDFIELLTDYMTMMTELAGIKMFVFINLRTLISVKELQRLHHNVNNHQLDMLLIESYDVGKIDNIPRIVIDNDQCEL